MNEEKSIKMMLSNLQVTSEAEVFDGSHQTLQVPKLQVTQ
jgi:hypothetical protein